MAASAGGKSAESSTSRANRGGIPRGPGGVSSTALDTTDTLVAYDNRTKSFALRTPFGAPRSLLQRARMPYYRQVDEIH
jgi:hypothetical protein